MENDKIKSPQTVSISNTDDSQHLLDSKPKEAYFTMLRSWVYQANMCQNAFTCFPYYLMANYPQLFQSSFVENSLLGNPTSASQPQGALGQPLGVENANNQPLQQANRFRADGFDTALRNEEIINQNGGYEYVIAPFWKRFIAEVIDALMLLVMKLMLTFSMVDLFEINWGIDFDLDTIKNQIENDYAEILSLTSELIILEIITKIFVCFFEALWTMQGQVAGGATPGKILMGLRIVHIEALVVLNPQQPGVNNGPLRALLYPAGNLGFQRAFLRAIAKNILMALLFPMCFVMFLFKHNRTGYDILTKTIVVEENPTRVLRRR